MHTLWTPMRGGRQYQTLNTGSIHNLRTFFRNLNYDDLTTLGKSTVPTATPDGKRKKTS